MKILLVYPPFLEPRMEEGEIAAPPIGLFYVAAYLREHGFAVDLVNAYHPDQKPEKMKEILEKSRPDLLGFSILNANRWGAVDIARTAKRHMPDVKVAVGGPGATFLWELLLDRFPEIDYAVLGEGEAPFLELARALEACENPDLSRIKGLAYRAEGKAVRTPDREPIQDLDRLPRPSKHFPYRHVTSSRGCPGNCTFCGSPRFWGRRVRFHSPHWFVAQLEELHRQGINAFYFSDDTFTLKKERVVAICKEILDRRLPITWAAISRVDLVDEELLAWMRRAGCTQISFGVESGSERIRKALKKHTTQDQVRRAFALTRSYGIMARAYFIYGNPGETEETIQETLDLIKDIRPLSVIFYILDLFPGTALYEDYLRRSGLDDEIWLQRIEDIMYWETDPELSRELVLAFGERLRSGFYGMLPEFARDIDLVDEPEFRPYHADFLSRLALTFTHGDYAEVDAIPEKEEIAEALFRRALTYGPDHRAYLGLGMLLQKSRSYRESMVPLSEGMKAFPQSEDMASCLAVSHMNLGEFREALKILMPFVGSPAVVPYIVQCYQALGEHEKARELARKATS